jgi:hypothetical protein
MKKVLGVSESSKNSMGPSEFSQEKVITPSSYLYR